LSAYFCHQKNNIISITAVAISNSQVVTLSQVGAVAVAALVAVSSGIIPHTKIKLLLYM
jgi:uncharacterized paraquat-inducible protein A